MTKVFRVSLADTTVGVLLDGLRDGRWRAKLPGQLRLAKELGVSRRTLALALARLTNDGVISSAGARRVPVILNVPAKTVAEPDAEKSRHLRVALLLMTPMDRMNAECREYVHQIMMILQAEGHHGMLVIFPRGKNPHKTGYLPKMVKEARADAWLVFEGTGEVLQWFVEKGPPAMALGGRCRHLRIASVGTDSITFIDEVLEKLTGLGHRRIVLISPENWRHPEASSVLVAFRRKLDSVGVRSGEYHVPDWDETPQGLRRLLDALFRVTPPTAILCWAPLTVHGVQAWLLNRGLRIPEDVSITTLWNEVACDWSAPDLNIARPSESGSIVFYRRIRLWLSGVAAGKNDTTQTNTPTRLDPGNSLGPAKE